MSTAPTPRQKRRAKRLRNIKNAALDLVIEDGVGHFSVHRLADRVDLTAGALYRYFASRDEILVTIQLEVLDTFDVYLDNVLRAQPDAAPLARVALLCRGYVALEELQPERFRLIAHLVASPEPVFEDDVAQPALQKTFAMLEKLVVELRAAESAGQLDAGDAGWRAFTTWSCIQGLVDRKKLLRFGDDDSLPARLTDDLVRTLMIGWGADASTIDAVLAETVALETFAASLEEE